MDKRLLEILVCPACKGQLVYQKSHNELWCRAEKLAFPIQNDIPVMLVEQARKLNIEELS